MPLGSFDLYRDLSSSPGHCNADILIENPFHIQKSTGTEKVRVNPGTFRSALDTAMRTLLQRIRFIFRNQLALGSFDLSQDLSSSSGHCNADMVIENPFYIQKSTGTDKLQLHPGLDWSGCEQLFPIALPSSFVLTGPTTRLRFPRPAAVAACSWTE